VYESYVWMHAALAGSQPLTGDYPVAGALRHRYSVYAVGRRRSPGCCLPTVG